MHSEQHRQARREVRTPRRYCNVRRAGARANASDGATTVSLRGLGASANDRDRRPDATPALNVPHPLDDGVKRAVIASVPTPNDRTNAVILVVDDDPALRRTLSAMLVHAGHEVIGAADGETALELARERAIDIAFVDRQMEGLDGIAVLKRLRDMQPMCTRVLLSGALDLDTALEAINLGAATHVIEKPIGMEALNEVVANTMRERERMAEAYHDLERVHRSAARMRLLTLLASEDLQLALQPIVDASDRSVTAYECLLRSADPVLSGPLSVLRAAEEHGLIGRLGEAVSLRAAAILARLPGNIRLFINLHPMELADPEGLDERLRLLQRHAHRVTFEITERSSLADAHGWEKSIESIARRGFTIAVDDLGSGYSSLSVLAELQPRFIKIDMSIVRDIDRIPRKQRLFDLLCRFADATDTLVVAEGIETEAEAETITSCGAHLMQGYWFARPELSDIVLRRIEGERAA
jgi:EAL domain-containing protein (putative c-di-GMP-specific phosphodiesterase class I)